MIPLSAYASLIVFSVGAGGGRLVVGGAADFRGSVAVPCNTSDQLFRVAALPA